MPLDTIGSYVSVMDAFLAHWTDANTELGAPPAPELMLQGAYQRADFLADRDAIEDSITSVTDAENARQTAAAARDTQKAALRTRLSQFRAVIRAMLPDSRYPRATPVVPPFTTHESKFLAAFDDMLSLWTRINADATLPGFTPPLLLGTYAIATFTTELTAMRAAFTAVTTAENDLDLGRKSRDVLLDPARERMIQYRNMVEGTFGAEHPLTLSLPSLFSPPGTTPDPVTLTGDWNTGDNQAHFTWTESTDPDLEEYELRWSGGFSYNPATAAVAANFLPGQLAGQTDEGLPAPGTSSYKIFVKLTTGNEAGSNTVTVTRPAP